MREQEPVPIVVPHPGVPGTQGVVGVGGGGPGVGDGDGPIDGDGDGPIGDGLGDGVTTLQ